MPNLLTQVLHRLSPSLHRWLRGRLATYPKLARTVIRRTGLQVAAGPFAGMRFPGPEACHRIVPKLLGAYEAELHWAVEGLCAQRWARVINVGAAEGYYAVGLARRLPGVVVTAFEADPRLAASCRRLAKLNGVDGQVELRGRCDSAELAALPLEGALLVMDCEGCEAGLLEPALAGRLRATTLLLETHDFLVPGITLALREAFVATHRALQIEQAPRDPGDWPTLGGLGTEEQALALDEERRVDGRAAEQHWLLLTPHPPR